MQTLTLDLGQSSYPIYIGRGLLDNQSLFKRHIGGHQVFIVSNTTIAPYYLDRVRSALADYQCDHIVLADGEQYKTLTIAADIFDQLLEKKHHRDTTIIALGGGVVGDIAGFVAACYQRGVHFIQIPTSLLAQVDAAIGGKTAVNHPLGKNMIGAFHQPNCVLIDLDCMQTLAEREYQSGIAEIIKYAMLADRAFFQWLEKHMHQLLTKESDVLCQAVERSCAIKAELVAADEKEIGQRALLNLGHTFAHAIENATGYQQWLHGEAVAVGLYLAADLSCRLGYIQTVDVERVKQLLQAARLPYQPPKTMNPQQFIELMSRDKKVLHKRLRLVLLKSVGEAIVTDKVPPQLLQQSLQS